MVSEPASCAIRRASPDELTEVRRLLPQVFTAGSAPDIVLVAAGKASRPLLGAAAVSWQAWGKPPGFPFLLHVIEPARRRGIGRALVAAVARACRGETERLRGWRSVDEDSDAEAFLRAVGFSVTRRVLHFEGDAQAFYDEVGTILKRIAASGRMPREMTISPLAVIEAPPLARFVSETFGSAYETCLVNARGIGPNAWDRERSMVLRIGGQIKGALLGRWRDGMPEVDVLLVAPELRGGWANVAMLGAAMDVGLTAGVSRFRLCCEDSQINTMKLARRVAARERHVVLEFTASPDAILAASSAPAGGDAGP